MLLVFNRGSELKIKEYIDSDFITDIDDRKSTSRCIFLCNVSMVSWKSFKQSIIIDSTMEVEYIIIFEAAKEVFWFKKFIVELDMMPSDAIILHCDNNDTIALAKEPKSHQKFKHMEWWFHIICEYFEKKFVEVQRVDSTQKMVDPLTKPLNQ